MHSFQNFIVKLIPNHPPPLETRIWKLVVRALSIIRIAKRAVAPMAENRKFVGGLKKRAIKNVLNYIRAKYLTFPAKDWRRV